MFIRTLFVSLLFLGAGIVNAWTGPTQTAPNGNVSAPVNIGTTDQVKDAGLGVDTLAVFGNAILSGASRYFNFGTTAGSSGYGIRDNAGVMELKDSGGTWSSIQNTVYTLIGGGTSWTTSGSDIYNANSGNVGVGKTSPAAKLDVNGSAAVGLISNRVKMGQGLAAGESGLVLDYNTIAANTARIQSESQGIAYRDLALNPSGGNVGIGIAIPTQKLHVAGTVLASAFLYSSDARFKENVKPIESALWKLLRLNGVEFDWAIDNDGHIKNTRDVGVLAQEVEAVYPEAVTTNPNSGYKAVDYPRLVPLLIEAIKEQQKTIDSLEKRMQILEERMYDK